MKKLGRYSIYRMIGKNIEITGEDFSRKGECTDVFRDPVAGQLVIEIEGERHCFHEPETMMEVNGKTILSYGSSEEFDDRHEDAEDDDGKSTEEKLVGFHRITKEHSCCRRLTIALL